MEYILLFITAVIAGALNSVAGGGSFFTFPMLLFTGMNPIIANATNTMALWPGNIAGVFAFKKELKANRHKLPVFITTSLIGSGIGALLLLATPEATFSWLIPYLLLFATVLFAFSNTMTKLLHKWRSVHVGSTGSIILQLVIAAYGGYFGGGMGIMMLAMLSFMGLTNIHEMNALKTLLATTINAIAVLIFIIAGIIAWPQAVIMITGAVMGGYGGAYYSKRVSASKVRKFVILNGFIMTVYFFLKP